MKADMLIPFRVASKGSKTGSQHVHQPVVDAFSIRGYKYVRTAYQDGQVIFTIDQEPKTLRCEACGWREVQPEAGTSRPSGPCLSAAGQRFASSPFHESPAGPEG